MLGVAVVTLRRWDKAGTLAPLCRTPGGHRRYDLSTVRDKLGLEPAADKRTVAYGYLERVFASSAAMEALKETWKMFQASTKRAEKRAVGKA